MNLMNIGKILFVVIAFHSLAASADDRTSLDLVACPGKGLAKVDLYNAAGQVSGVKIDAYIPVAKFQGWGKNEIIVRGMKFDRVQVASMTKPNAQPSYLFADAIQTEAGCHARRGEPVNLLPPNLADVKPVAKPGKVAAASPANDDDEGEDEDDNSAPDVPVTAVATNGAGGLKNPNCCGFPLATRPRSFLAGMGRFGAGRPGRLHAGVDLYGKLHQAVSSLSNGDVIRAPYFFKRRTLAVDVHHQGGFVARYGEITGQNFGLRLGTKVKRGQQLGVMSYVKGAPSAMLHLELYKGTVGGKLSAKSRGNRYNRRADLVNPTPYIKTWGKYR